MTEEPVSISDWIQYLISQKNHAYTIIFGIIASIFGLSILAYYLRDGAENIGFWAMFIPIAIFTVLLVVTTVGKKSPLKRPEILLNKIMKEEKTDVDEIRREWFEEAQIMWRRQIVRIFRWGLPVAGVGCLIYATYLIRTTNQELNAISLYSLGIGLISFGVALFAYKISGESKEIAKGSDEKMKSISTAFFMDISFIFEQNKNKIKSDISVVLRDYLIWQNRRLVLRAVQLKDWVEPEIQEDLVKYFISGENSMIKGLRAKQNLKLSSAEKANIRCMYDDLKKLNLKNKDIERPSDLIDD